MGQIWRRQFLIAASALLAGIPSALRAQKSERVRVIGLIGVSTPTRQTSASEEAFLASLRQHGFVEGKNLTVLRRYSEGQNEKFQEFTEEFVRLKVDLIVTPNSAATHAAKNATRTIPILAAIIPDPVRQGLVASLARPGGNITGMTNHAGTGFSAKLLQILKEAVPKVSRVAVFFDPGTPGSVLALKETDLPTGAALKLAIVPIEVRSPADLELAFQSAVDQRVDGLYPHLVMFPYRVQFVEFAARRRLPMVVENGQWAELGALIGHGIDFKDQYRRVGLYAAKILLGAAPGELPIEQPTKFDFVVNARTAKALGLSIPPALLARADQVIE